jgi:hypothetical protein
VLGTFLHLLTLLTVPHLEVVEVGLEPARNLTFEVVEVVAHWIVLRKIALHCIAGRIVRHIDHHSVPHNIAPYYIILHTSLHHKVVVLHNRIPLNSILCHSIVDSCH